MRSPRGRTVDHARLNRLVEDGAAVLLTGPSGTGKSTTISAMAGRAEEAGLRVVSVFPNAARADTAMGALSLAFGRELAESGGHESHLRLAGSDDLDVLAIDDIHLMDRPGVDAVCHLIEQTGIAVVMTHAAEAPIVDELARTLDRLQVDVVRLDNLAPNDVAELAQDVLGEDLAPAAAEEVVRLTGGNPRLITHLLRAARDEDTLAASAEGVTLTAVPLAHGAIQTAIAHLTAGLEADHLESLQRIAATGPAPTDELAPTTDDHALTRLEDSGLVQFRPVGRRLLAEVTTPLVRDGILASMSSRLLRSLRADAATHIATADATDRSDQIRLATWSLTGAVTATPHDLATAADFAFEAGDLATAAALSSAAFDAEPNVQSGLRADKCLYELADTEALADFHARWRQRVATPAEELELDCCVAKAAFWRDGDVTPLDVLAEQAESGAGGRVAAAHAASLLVVSGDIHTALRLASPHADDEPSREHALITLALAHGHRASGQPRLALRALDRARDAFASLGGRIPAMTENVLSGARAQALAEAGLFAEHRASVTRSAALAREVGSAKEVGLARLAESWGHLIQGQRGRAIAAAQIAAGEFQLARHPGMERWAIGVEALAEASAGDPGRATQLLEELGRREHPARIFATNEARAIAWLAFRRADHAEAQRAFSEAAIAARERGNVADTVFAATDLSRIGGAAVDLIAPFADDLGGRLLPALAEMIDVRERGDAEAHEKSARRLDAAGVPHLALEMFHAAATKPDGTTDRSFMTDRRRLALLTDHPMIEDLVPAAIRALTPREAEVARLSATGLTSREVGDVLFISPRTVETHLARIYEKLQVANRAGLIEALQSLHAI